MACGMRAGAVAAMNRDAEEKYELRVFLYIRVLVDSPFGIVYYYCYCFIYNFTAHHKTP